MKFLHQRYMMACEIRVGIATSGEQGSDPNRGHPKQYPTATRMDARRAALGPIRFQHACDKARRY